MGRRKVSSATVAAEIARLQEKIVAKWGEDYIREARLRLCSQCERQQHCHLFPVCLDGTACPYYKEKVTK